MSKSNRKRAWKGERQILIRKRILIDLELFTTTKWYHLKEIAFFKFKYFHDLKIVTYFKVQDIIHAYDDSLLFNV